MFGTIPPRLGRLVAAACVSVALFALAATAASAAEVIYSDLPSPKPGNVVSLGFEATQTAEFGGQVQFAGTARKNPTVTVIGSSWGCQSGTWSAKNCASTMGAKFEWPVTFNVYAVGPENTIGAELASGSKVFKIPYRPSASPKCTGAQAGEWFHAGECFNGKSFKLSLGLKAANLPEKAIVTVAYNTSDYGTEPQRPKPCDSEAQGCPYDSMNVGVQEGTETSPSFGSFPAPDIAYRNGAPESEWTGYQPLFEVKGH
jgi:hypothetical protein